MRGLTIAHAVCGVAGSMPPTGVFVRTALNTSLGATHRFSQVLNAAVVAIIAGSLMPLFSYLPQATIAALLVVASIRMVPWSYLMRLWQESKSTLLLCLITAAVCVGEDPVIGLVVGMVLALLDRAKRSVQAPSVRIECQNVECGRDYVVAVIGALTYVKADTFIQQVKTLDGVANVTLDLTDLYQLDHDGASALAKVAEAWMDSESMTEKKVVVIGAACTVFPVLRANLWFSKEIQEGRVRLSGNINDGVKESTSNIHRV
jgi:MFS superfamily sulfate permease-like transporter